MKPDRLVISLGWYVRFVPPSHMAAMSQFYSEVIGLPRPLHWRTAKGDPEDKDYFWGGEAIILDHNYGGHELPIPQREAHPDTARQMQIFRVSDLDQAIARLTSRGAEISPLRACTYGREAFVKDPMGMLFGLRETAPDSPYAHDAEARRRQRRGEAFNPGCAPLPPYFQEIGWVRITASDPRRIAGFYRDALGLTQISSAGAALFDLGDNTVLEIAGGGEARAIPPAQMASGAAVILRVTNLAALLPRLTAASVPMVGQLYTSLKGDWAYVADPDGNVIGLAERTHPGSYAEALSVAPEDLEAARRWAERNYA